MGTTKTWVVAVALLAVHVLAMVPQAARLLAAVQIRPRHQMVIPITPSAPFRRPIQSLTITVEIAGVQSDVGLSPVVSANLVHSQWCNKVGGAHEVPLQDSVPTPAVTFEVSSQATKVIETPGWTDGGVCLVIRPVGKEIGMMVSEDAWVVHLNVGVEPHLNWHQLALQYLFCATVALCIARIVGDFARNGVAEPATAVQADPKIGQGDGAGRGGGAGAAINAGDPFWCRCAECADDDVDFGDDDDDDAPSVSSVGDDGRVRGDDRPGYRGDAPATTCASSSDDDSERKPDGLAGRRQWIDVDDNRDADEYEYVSVCND